MLAAAGRSAHKLTAPGGFYRNLVGLCCCGNARTRAPGCGGVPAVVGSGAWRSVPCSPAPTRFLLARRSGAASPPRNAAAAARPSAGCGLPLVALACLRGSPLLSRADKSALGGTSGEPPSQPRAGEGIAGTPSRRYCVSIQPSTAARLRCACPRSSAPGAIRGASAAFLRPRPRR